MENKEEYTAKVTLETSETEYVNENGEFMHKQGSYDPVKEAKSKIIWFVVVVVLLIVVKVVFKF